MCCWFPFPVFFIVKSLNFRIESLRSTSLRKTNPENKNIGTYTVDGSEMRKPPLWTSHQPPTTTHHPADSWKPPPPTTHRTGPPSQAEVPMARQMSNPSRLAEKVWRRRVWIRAEGGEFFQPRESVGFGEGGDILEFPLGRKFRFWHGWNFG